VDIFPHGTITVSVYSMPSDWLWPNVRYHHSMYNACSKSSRDECTTSL